MRTGVILRRPRYAGWYLHKVYRYLANYGFSIAQFKPKPFGDHDLDIAVDACGVCGSDVHTITGGWGQAQLPVCVGHEAVGRVVRVGPKVNTVKLGERVGVGAQVGACLECKNCKSDNENYCAHQVGKSKCGRESARIVHDGLIG
jgi:D-arabinose 1-dehydrogenase-like Zn-dependent alcohol dehydrogenase